MRAETPRAVSVEPVAPLKLRIGFDNGETLLVDISETIARIPLLAQLSDPACFVRARVGEFGLTMKVWGTGSLSESCPEVLRGRREDADPAQRAVVSRGLMTCKATEGRMSLRSPPEVERDRSEIAAGLRKCRERGRPPVRPTRPPVQKELLSACAPRHLPVVSDDRFRPGSGSGERAGHADWETTLRGGDR